MKLHSNFSNLPVWKTDPEWLTMEVPFSRARNLEDLRKSGHFFTTSTFCHASHNHTHKNFQKKTKLPKVMCQHETKILEEFKKILSLPFRRSGRESEIKTEPQHLAWTILVLCVHSIGQKIQTIRRDLIPFLPSHIHSTHSWTITKAKRMSFIFINCETPAREDEAVFFPTSQ